MPSRRNFRNNMVFKKQFMNLSKLVVNYDNHDETISQEPQKIDNWGGGAHIHIFVFTNCKNNRFQKKLMMHSTNI